MIVVTTTTLPNLDAYHRLLILITIALVSYNDLTVEKNQCPLSLIFLVSMIILSIFSYIKYYKKQMRNKLYNSDIQDNYYIEPDLQFAHKNSVIIDNIVNQGMVGASLCIIIYCIQKLYNRIKFSYVLFGMIIFLFSLPWVYVKNLQNSPGVSAITTTYTQRIYNFKDDPYIFIGINLLLIIQIYIICNYPLTRPRFIMPLFFFILLFLIGFAK